MVGHAKDEVEKLLKIVHLKTPLVFPALYKDGNTKPANIRGSWDAAVEKAKLEDFRFHDLRHTAASYLAMSGASMPELAAILGHRTYQMVKRYTHLSHAHTKSVVEKMNKSVFGG